MIMSFSAAYSRVSRQFSTICLRIVLPSILLAVFTPICADPANSSQANTASAQQANPPLPPNASTCPAPDQLVKNNLLWGAPGGWSTHNASFVNKIGSFIGAYWVGVNNLGQVICIYKGVEKFNFPLQLNNADYIKQPNFGKWQFVPGKNGLLGCAANNVVECPFFTINSNNSIPSMQQLENIKPASDDDANGL